MAVFLFFATAVGHFAGWGEESREAQEAVDQQLPKEDPKPEPRFAQYAELEKFCRKNFEQSGQCPEKECVYSCTEGTSSSDCPCRPRDCVELNPADCLLDVCQILDGCGETQRCYPRPDMAEPPCGKLGYAGKMECCEGFTKRCGVKYFGGTCDMLGEYSMNGIPLCVPCGNGVCNQFENSCSCPEDCE